jgi:hypothetical protein
VFFFCLVETKDSDVPHMELLPADDLDEARFWARRMLTEHAMPVAAHIFRNDERLDTLRP